MDWVVIDGVKPWDGRYELDLAGAPLTSREWGWIKRFAGYLPADLDGRTFTDPEVISVLAIVSLHRAGKVEPRDVPDLWERLQDVPFGSTITLELGETEEDDEVADPTESSNGNEPSSGASSQTGSGSSGSLPSPTGHPASAISGSAPATSVT